MSLLLLAACGLFQPADTDDTPTDRPARDTDAGDTTDDTTDTEDTRGSSVHFATTDVPIPDDDATYEVEVPENGTFVRVDSCYQGDELVCDVWDGGYQLYDDGSLVLTPSVWDGSLARVTWLVIE